MPYTWIADKLLQIFNFRKKVNVLVHEAFFVNSQNKESYYFIKVVNCSPEAVITITHVWIKDEARDIDVINYERPLPHKLEKSDIWETWIEKNRIYDRRNVFKNVRVELSDGKVYKSKENKKVRPIGFIAK